MNSMKMNYVKYALGLALFFAFGCSNTKYLADGELLYVGGTVKVEDSILKKKERKNLAGELKDLLRPKPNKQIFGLRPKLLIYNLAGEPKKEKGIRYWLRNKVGEAPVLFSQVDLDYNAALLRNYTENKGYFKVRVSADSTTNGKKVSAQYLVKPYQQYLIKEVKFQTDSTKLSQQISRMIERRSLLKVGQPYDLDKIKAERERIDSRLKERGYYYFNPDYLLAQVDSSKGNHEVSINLKIKEETPVKAKRAYRINDIVVYPNFSLEKDSVQYKKEDIKQYGDVTVIDSANTFTRNVFDRTLYFKKGDLYNRTDHNLTLNRFINLGTFNFVKNEFRESTEFPNRLDSYYYLTLLPKKFIRVEVKGKTNSASYTGTELNVNWNNRNLFGGAELLTLSLFGGADFQLGGTNEGYNIFKLGGQATLIWPRFVAPFKVETSSGYVPKTKAAIGYEFQQRTKLYGLNSFTASFGYIWKENIRKEHELKVIDVNYVSPNNVTDLYMSQVAIYPALQKIIDKQLIFGPTYSYTYTNTMQKRKKSTIYFKGELDLAGNITGLITGANVKQQDTVKILNVPFSQYAKLSADFRHYLKITRNSEIATRVFAGVGYSYGNSTAMPTTKQFVVGGTNSIRAFRSRSLGPGSYVINTDDSVFLPDQSGDIKLEINAEYRSKLFSIVNGALFIDAGNVWLQNKDPNKVGGEFSSNFMKELAVGVGAGLRFDLSFLVLRTDLAFPIRKPFLPEGERWVIDKVSLGDSAWRKDNLIFNIAIGYPF